MKFFFKARPTGLDCCYMLKSAAFVSTLLCSTYLINDALARGERQAVTPIAQHHEPQSQTPPHMTLLDPVVITSVAMSAPIVVKTDPKTPRQPIPASDGADYLKTIPGFSTLRNGGTNGDLVFRGMFGSRLNIRNDGGVILGACGGRMDNPTSYISPESYDQLTMIKGPQTVRWGPTGSAGTVLFEREPKHFDAPTVEGNTSVMFATNKRAEAHFDGTIGGKLGYARMITNKAFADDYKDGNGNRVPSQWDKWNTNFFLGWTPNRDTLFEINAGGGDGQAEYAGRGMDGTQFKRRSYGAKFVQTYAGDLLSKIEAQAYYNDADHVMDNFRLRGSRTKANPMESRVARQTSGGRLATTWEWDKITLVMGGDLQTNTHKKYNKTLSNWNNNAVSYNYGLFGEMTWPLAVDQRIIAGARIDWNLVKDKRAMSKTNGAERKDTLPSAFARYEYDLEKLPMTAYIGLGHAQRFPDHWELFSPSQIAGTYRNAFEGVKPEKTTQLDFGLQHRSDNTEIWASGYAGKIQDYILFDYRSGKSKAQNVDATILGAEAGLSHHFSSAWRLDTSIAYAFGKNNTDHEALPQIPPFEGRIGVNYEQDKWSVGGLLRLVAKQTRIAANKGNVVGQDYANSAGFGIFSLNGTYKLSNDVRFTAGVDNVFNKSYYEHLNKDGNAGLGFPSHYQIRESGRTFWTKVNFKF